jgi:uncharacterized protein YdeI (BOF family)
MKVTKKQGLILLIALLLALGLVVFVASNQNDSSKKSATKPKQATTKQIAATPMEYTGKTVTIKGYIVETKKGEYSLLNQDRGSQADSLIELDLSSIKDKEKYIPRKSGMQEGVVENKVVSVTGKLDKQLVLKAETVSD